MIAAAGIAALTRYAFSEAGKRAPVPDSAARLAAAGVARNADWQPVIRRINGLDMALVPAGCLTMGSTDEQILSAEDSCGRFYGIYDCLYDFKAAEQPTHQVCFEEPFWIGLNEVSHRQFGSKPSRNMNTWKTSRAWAAESMRLSEAREFCEARVLRLPTKAEWEYAARGPDGWIYPWGDEFNTHFLVWHTLVPDRVGLIDEGVSWVGAYDLAGGVLEWVSDWYGPYKDEPQTNPSGPIDGDKIIARGGSWFSYATFFVRATHREPFDPNYKSSVIGFRCAADFNQN